MKVIFFMIILLFYVTNAEKIIWETSEGRGMHLESTRTLAMRTKVHTM